MPTTSSHPYAGAITHVVELAARPATAEDAAKLVRAADMALAHGRYHGVTVTANTRLDGVPTHPALSRSLLGAAALLACQDGRYADPDMRDLFDAYVRVYDERDTLTPPLRLAATIGEWFAGPVSELTELVDAVLAATA